MFSNGFQPELLIAVVMPAMSGIEVAIVTRIKPPKRNILLFPGQTVTADLLAQARGQGQEFEIIAKLV
jgi:hypothetical protein